MLFFLTIFVNINHNISCKYDFNNLRHPRIGTPRVKQYMKVYLIYNIQALYLTISCSSHPL